MQSLPGRLIATGCILIYTRDSCCAISSKSIAPMTLSWIKTKQMLETNEGIKHTFGHWRMAFLLIADKMLRFMSAVRSTLLFPPHINHANHFNSGEKRCVFKRTFRMNSDKASWCRWITTRVDIPILAWRDSCWESRIKRAGCSDISVKGDRFPCAYLLVN